MLLVYYHSSFRKEAKGFFSKMILFSQPPNPPCLRRASNHSPTSRQSLAEGLIDDGQRPPVVKILVWLTELSPLRGEP